VDDHLIKGPDRRCLDHASTSAYWNRFWRSGGGWSTWSCLLSDHGHLLDRQTECRETADGLRWRRPGGASTKDELEVSSPRVVMPDGGRVVMPWSERLRYGAKKNGYHGGATPQEMLIPSVFCGLNLTRQKVLENSLPNSPRGGPSPRWPARSRGSQTTETSDEGGAANALRYCPNSQQHLWERNRGSKPLLQSEVFAVQKRLAGRVRIDDVTVQRLLVALASRGGSMTTVALPAPSGYLSIGCRAFLR